jgi:flagellar biosynthesis protein FlhF
MRIKSFFAKSVEEAIAQAREELGSEALLLNTRKLAGEAGKSAGYEVVFGLAGEEAAPASEPQSFGEELQTQVSPVAQLSPAPRIEPVAPSPLIPAPAAKVTPEAKAAPAARIKPAVKNAPADTPASTREEDPARELERLHAQLDEIQNLMARFSRHQFTAARSVPKLAEVYARLISAEVDPPLAKAIVDRVESSMATDAFFERVGAGSEKADRQPAASRSDARRLEELVRAEMARRVKVDARLGSEGAVIVLVGPAGAGKTTSLLKLAASPLAAGRSVRILTVDPAAASPLSSLSRLSNALGIEVAPVRAMQQLPELIADARKRDVVLIDTPGFAGNDTLGLKAAAGLFAKCPGLDVHLVVPAYMRLADLRRCVERYEIFRPAKLLVTKLDEAEALGPVFSEAARTGLSLSFLAHGPMIPDDIRPALLEDFAAMVFDRPQARTQSVA